MSENSTAHIIFNRWVIVPLAKLREIPNGDGTFAALSVAFGLYERYIDSELKRNSKKASPKNFWLAGETDLSILPADFQRFWEMYRVGMQHAFQPKRYIEKNGKGDKWGWDISSNKGYKHRPTIIKEAIGSYIITLDPWLFIEHVLKRWYEHPDLLNEINEFAFGTITVSEHLPPAETTDNAAPTASHVSAAPIATGKCFP